MKKRSLRAGLVTGPLVMALLLAGCGGDDGGDDDLGAVVTSTTEAEETTTSTAPPEDDGGLFDGDEEGGEPGSGLFDGGDEAGDDGDEQGTDSEDGVDAATFYGSDEIDVDLAIALHDACVGGDMQACDTMYLDAAAGSAAEELGATCGGALPEADRFCVDLASSTTGSYVPVGELFMGSEASEEEGVLLSRCAQGSMNACDALISVAGQGSEAFVFGATCGGRIDTEEWCADLFGLGIARAQEWMAENGL